MDEPKRPHAVLFDVVETLFALDPVADVLVEHGLDRTRLEVFFTRLLRDAFALGFLGESPLFRDVAESSLQVVAPHLDPRQRADVLAAFGRLDAHPDVRPALSLLRSQGIRVGALTNGSAEITATLLDRNGLAGDVELVMSVDEVGVWKPRPEPYLHALDRLGLPAERVAMVAVHAWDVHGARAAGLVTGWASRMEGTFGAVFQPPHVAGEDLVEVVAQLLALPD